MISFAEKIYRKEYIWFWEKGIMNSKLRSLLEIQVGMPCIYESQNEARAEDKNLDILCIAIVFKTGIE